MLASRQSFSNHDSLLHGSRLGCVAAYALIAAGFPMVERNNSLTGRQILAAFDAPCRSAAEWIPLEWQIRIAEDKPGRTAGGRFSRSAGPGLMMP